MRDLIRSNDPLVREVIVSGQISGSDVIPAAPGAAAAEPVVTGFAVDRGISTEPALCWVARALDDRRFVDTFSADYGGYTNTWQAAKDRS